MADQGEIKRRLLREKEAATYLGLSRSFLQKSRNPKKNGGAGGPAFLRLPSGSIRYSLDDLNSFVETRCVRVPAAAVTNEPLHL